MARWRVRGSEGGQNGRRRRHKSVGRPKVPRNTKQKNDHTLQPCSLAEHLRAADYFPIIYPRGGGTRGRQPRWVAVFRQRGGSASCARAHRTDTIAAINTGEQPLTSPAEGPILYFISKLIPRDQIYCKKGVKKYTFPSLAPISLISVRWKRVSLLFFSPPFRCLEFSSTETAKRGIRRSVLDIHHPPACEISR